MQHILKRYMLSILILLLCVSVLSHQSMADTGYSQREKEPFADIGENYVKKPKENDIVRDDKTGISYVKNQLLISCTIGTDKAQVEKMVKDMGADIVGYIALTSDYQIEFSQDKNIQELESLAHSIETKTFVEQVTLNVVLQASTQTSRQENMDGWAKEEVKKAIQMDLIPINLQNHYKEPINRKDFAQLVVSCIEAHKGKKIEDIVELEKGEDISKLLEKETFLDTDDVNVIVAKVLGIIKGRDEKHFDPQGKIVREEAAVLLEKTARYLGKEMEEQTVSFKDTKDISSWAKKSVEFVCTFDIMKGTKDHRFKPKDYYTRQEAYVTMYRLFLQL